MRVLWVSDEERKQIAPELVKPMWKDLPYFLAFLFMLYISFIGFTLVAELIPKLFFIFLFLFFLSGPVVLTSNEAVDEDFVVLYGEGVYVNDHLRGGFFLKKGDVDRLVLIDGHYIIFKLRHSKRGVKYLSSSLKEFVEPRVLDMFRRVLEPDEVISLESRGFFLFHNVVAIASILPRGVVEPLKEYLEIDHSAYFNVLGGDLINYYGRIVRLLIDYLYGLGERFKALVIAISTTLLNPEDWIRSLSRGMNETLRYKFVWRFVGDDSRDDLTWNIIGGLTILMLLLIVLHGSCCDSLGFLIKYREFIGMAFIYMLTIWVTGVGVSFYYLFNKLNYWEHYYIHDGFKSKVYFIVRLLFDVVVSLFIVLSISEYLLISVSLLFWFYFFMFITFLFSGGFLLFLGVKLADRVIENMKKIDPNIINKVRDSIGEECYKR